MPRYILGLRKRTTSSNYKCYTFWALLLLLLLILLLLLLQDYKINHSNPQIAKANLGG